jgi:hypothetical protein
VRLRTQPWAAQRGPTAEGFIRLELQKGYDGGMARARGEPGLPPGLVYERQFLDEREEQELLGGSCGCASTRS